MSDYHSSSTFLQSNSTESNGYNVFPSVYMSKGVGGKRRSKRMKKETKKDEKKGGGCGCSKLFGGKKGKQNKRSMKHTKNGKNKTKKDKR